MVMLKVLTPKFMRNLIVDLVLIVFTLFLMEAFALGINFQAVILPFAVVFVMVHVAFEMLLGWAG